MATAKRSFMKLDETPQEIVWPETHYAFIEKIGPFQETAPQAWQAVNQLIPTISERNKITGFMSLYKVEPKIYRAGVALDAAPTDLPEGMQYTKFTGGNYVRFVLTGAYSNLPEACGRVFLIVAEKKIPQRDDFCIENYVNDPRTTPEEQLITEILIPTA
jgi:DNA gyrase inhibitor GyrI